MNNKYNFYLAISISFALLFYSLFLSYNSIDSTSKMIDIIEHDQLKLFKLATKLEDNIKEEQTSFLQSALLDRQDKATIDTSFNKLNILLKELTIFGNHSSFKSQKLTQKLNLLTARIVGYKAVESSIIEAFKNHDKDDIADALIGFNAISIKFSSDIQGLIHIIDQELEKQILELKSSNNSIKNSILYSFIIAFLLILFTIYKLLFLNKQVKLELKRAEKAEGEQLLLQQQLKEYNDNLEEEIARKTEEIYQRIFTNRLSSIPNRNKLIEDMKTFNFKYMAILDIDKFQKFNDIYGEELGNIALGMSATFLQKKANQRNAYFYHTNGDEFLYAITSDSNITEEDFTQDVKLILKEYKSEEFTYQDKNFSFMLSAGLSFTGKDKILAYADMALKDAKMKNIQLAIFRKDRQLEKEHKEDIECYKKLSTAFKTDNVVQYFQPIVPIQDDSKPIKYESLVRLIDTNGKVIPPFNFIKVAKLHREYYKITRAVIKNTLFTIKKYQVPCSLNFSLQDIQNKRTMDAFYTILNEFKFNELLTIELLETEEIQDYKITYDFCMKMKTYNVKIAIDDFGSGYSNFSHVLKLPVDYIKIDASLISNINRNKNSKIMVETIVALAKKLNVLTIAEFVASKEIYDTVKALNVDYVQGYYLGKPEPIKKYI